MKNKIQKSLITIGSLLFIYFVLLNTVYFNAPVNKLTSGYKSPDAEKMQQLIISLNKSNIPFIRDIDGFIRYEQSFEDIVNSLIEDIEGIRFGKESRKYSDKEHNEIFKDVLTSLNIEYKVDERENGEYILYDSGDISKDKIDSVMSEFVAKKLGSQCGQDNAGNISTNQKNRAC